MRREGQRVAIIDRALDIGGWSADERAVVSWYTGAARKYQLRTLADYAVTVCRDRGDLVEGSGPGRWRIARAVDLEAHPYGRVYTVAVGVAGSPVDDSWSAAEQHCLWLSQRSLQLS